MFPQTKAQRCWFHKSANVPAALPKSAHPGAVRAMHDIHNAEHGDLAKVAAKAFAIDYGAKFPKAVPTIADELDVLPEFYKYPAEHRVRASRLKFAELVQTTPTLLRSGVGSAPPGDQDDKSPVNREIHAGICNSRRVKLPPATRPWAAHLDT